MFIVYKIIFEKRKVEKQYPYYYIGSKSNCKIENNLILDKRGKPYYGSSKYKSYKNIVNENIQNLTIDILYIGTSYKDCILKENEYHINENVVKSPEYFNCSNAINNTFHDPDFILMRNVKSNKCCRLHKNDDILNSGEWVGCSKNFVWHNDGNISKLFHKDNIPDGWVKGRLWNSNYKTTKGIKMKKEHVEKGVATRHKNKSYDAWNKGLKDQYITSEETRKKQSESHKGKRLKEKNPMYGKRWINNGIINQLITQHDILPTGWNWGQLRKLPPI